MIVFCFLLIFVLLLYNMIGHRQVNAENIYDGNLNTRASIPFQPQLGPSMQKFEPEREVYSYYRTQILQPSSGYPSTITLKPGTFSQNKTRFDINPCMFNMRTLSLSFQCNPTDDTFGEPGVQAIIPNSYFPWIKSFKLIAQPNSTILFQCDNVDQYTLMHGYVNLNQNKRLIQEGLIVPSRRTLCGYEAFTANGSLDTDLYLSTPQSTGDTQAIMPDVMNDPSQFYSGTIGAGKFPQLQTINIKFSDLFFDSIFQHEDYLWKYGCYIEIEWQNCDNIIWAITPSGSTTTPSDKYPSEDKNRITIKNISLQIDQQQNKYLEEAEELQNSKERYISVPYIYEFNGSIKNPQLIFQLMNQSNYPQKLYKLYASLIYPNNKAANYQPLTDGNILTYTSDGIFCDSRTGLQAGYYNEIKLSLDNQQFDDILFDNVDSLNMLLRRIKRQFPDTAHSGIKSLLCNCSIPFKFDDVYKDTEFYMSKQSKGIEISHKILPIKIELKQINDLPTGSYIKAFVVVMRTFKFVNSQWYYV